ncbi:L-lactate dehydrogenase complex protein LldE [Paraburkholderia sp. GAS206C]
MRPHPERSASSPQICRPLDSMKVALFIPCFIDAFYPEVGIATLELLERFGIEVDYPQEQTCCGQPMANSGAQAEAAGAEKVFARNFAGYDYIVGPSSSCIHHVREHLTAIEQTSEVKKVRAVAYELVEFLHDVVGARDFPWAEFPHRVGLHNSCSALRHLKEASVSEIAGTPFSKPLALLKGVKGIEFVKLARPDECCGFGGTFSVTEEPVSVRMGQDKVRDHLNAGAEYIVSGDMSCLMHQQGCAERMKADARFIHIAQVLNGARE